MDNPNHAKPRRDRRLIWLVGVAFFSPVFAIVWATRALCSRARWRQVFVGASILVNIVFVSVIAIAYFDENVGDDTGDDQLGAMLAPDCFERAPGALRFCSAREDSELARILPNAVYVVSAGVTRARFDFEDDTLRGVTDITACDKYGRSWVLVDLDNRTIMIDHYPGDAESEPDMTLRDKDADGIPDVMVDWVRGEGFERVHDIVWRPLKKGD